MDSNSLDRILQGATSSGNDGVRVLPGVVFMAKDIKRSFSYTKAYGIGSWSKENSEIEVDGVCFAASMTKLMTSVAAMQAVERGLIGLDDDVSAVLHEWKDAQILEGFGEDGKPQLRKAANKLTLRLLLSHSSGIAYDVMDPRLIQWKQSRGEESGTFSGSIDAGYTFPLLFEPGEGWSYGAGIDWAGRLVERLNGNITLGEYMQKHIWQPLGMDSSTFKIDKEPSLQKRRVDMSNRNAAGNIRHLQVPLFASPAKDDCGGIGLYTTAPDYMKILEAVLRSDDRILKPATVNEMFKPQLPDPVHLENVLKIPGMKGVLSGNLPDGVKVNHGLGGMLMLEPLPSGRRAWSMQWGGMPNLFWWIDRESGIIGTYFSQLMPTGDPKSVELWTELEKEVYRTL